MFHDDVTSAFSWEAVIDDFVREILGETDPLQGAIDSIEVAIGLGLEVVFDASQAGRARIQRLGRRQTIFLKPDDRQERLQWAVAHELGEANAHILFERLGIQLGPDQEHLREKLANEFASRLLLPTDPFQKLCRDSDWDVYELKAHFATASHELIAWRMLDDPNASVVTIFDHGRITRRRSNQARRPPALLPVERDCWAKANESGKPLGRIATGVAVKAWPVHIPGWRREILRTTPIEDFE